jgi:hypothetical protein
MEHLEQQLKEFEKEFDVKFNGKIYFTTVQDEFEFTETPINNQLKSFISQKLTEQKEEIIKEVSGAVGAVESGIISKEKGYGEIIDIIKKL